MDLIKLTNRVALISVLLLIYWVFIFICSSVFGFKVVQTQMTEMFMLSILGIFAILAGAIILNIMYNLTAIARGRPQPQAISPTRSRRLSLLFAGSFALIFGLLYLGDAATTSKRERTLLNTANSLIEEQQTIIQRLGSYRFERDYIAQATNDLIRLQRIESQFPQITVIVRDSIEDDLVLMGFSSTNKLRDNQPPSRLDYLVSTTAPERRYLHGVFDAVISEPRYSSQNNKQEVFYPIVTGQGRIVLHLSQFNRYGKFGS